MSQEDNKPEDTHEFTSLIERQVSRRGFLRTGAIAGAGLFGGVSMVSGYYAVLSSTDPPAREVPPPVEALPTLVSADTLEALSEDEALTLEAIAARIIPGSANDPGAREAGVIYYIDAKLSVDDGLVEPTYLQEPFDEQFESGGAGEDADASSGTEEEISGAANDAVGRYGYQSPLTPLDFYQQGLAALDRAAEAAGNGRFVDLSEDDQDALLESLDDGDVEEFDEVDAAFFFQMVREDVIEGMFCDPIYGGNRNMVGWRMIDYPGAQRGYTPFDIKTPGIDREPQSLIELHAFSPGRPESPESILPVGGPTGRDEGEEDAEDFEPEHE